jgi:hypothetical protein
MVPVAIDIAGLRVDYDPGAGRWRLDGVAGTHVLRPWTWGERRRLVGACRRDDGILDRDAFVAGLTDLLLDPPPPDALRPLFAYVCLRLQGVGRVRPTASLAAAEGILAAAYGWRPGDLEAQPAAALDELVAAPAAGGAGPRPPEPGWTRIVIADDGEPAS